MIIYSFGKHQFAIYVGKFCRIAPGKLTAIQIVHEHFRNRNSGDFGRQEILTILKN